MTTVQFKRPAMTALLEHVRKGYEELYKCEVGGLLLGYRKDRTVHIRKTVPYRTPRRSRTGWDPNIRYLERRGVALETVSLKWIGTYHSHVEIGRSASTGQSVIDQESHLLARSPLEIIVRITEHKMKSPHDCFSLSDTLNHERTYYFDICAYWKTVNDSIKRLKVRTE